MIFPLVFMYKHKSNKPNSHSYSTVESCRCGNGGHDATRLTAYLLTAFVAV